MRIEVNGSRNRSRWQLGRVLIELHCWHLGPRSARLTHSNPRSQL